MLSRMLFWMVAWMLSSIPIVLGEAGGLFARLRRRRHQSNNSTEAPQDEIQTRIIGGSEVNPSDNRYPYFVSMRGTGICGGVLITPSIALTAAHCEPSADSVIVGMQSLDQSFEQEYFPIAIEQKVVNPLYGSVGYSYDAMLLKLATPSNQQYITLNLNDSLPVVDQQLWVLGFGDIAASEKEQVLPDVLNEVDVQYIDPTACAMEYGDNLIHGDMLCAASNGKDACAGDSGGPLIIKGNSPTEDVLVGTVAWGIGCADARYPGVYSRTSAFIAWIFDQVCQLSPGDAPAYMGCNLDASVKTETTVPDSAPTDPTADANATPAPSNPITTIKFIGWNPQRRGVRMGLCQGDCDNNSDCAGDLICSRVLADKTMSQCQLGTNEMRTNFDVCINP